MTKPLTIVVAYASIGSGHRIAAEALHAELQNRGPDVPSELVNVLDFASRRISGNLLTRSFTGSTAGMYDRLWSSEWAGRAGRSISQPILGMMLSAFGDYLLEARPDAVICTHSMAATIAARLVKRGAADFKTVNVTTDYGVHGYWPREGVSLFCVANEGSVETLRARGFTPDAIALTGVPVRAQFRLDYDREAARKHFDLPIERRLILALAGSTMPGPYEHFKEALAVSLPALASLPDTSLAIVCGRDESFAEEIRSRAAGFGTTNVHVFGFVDHMAPLMASADLALAKPGGAVCAECLATGVPLVLVGPAVGQERANAEALAGAGAALYSKDPRTIAEYTRNVIVKPARLESLRASAGKLARPFAAVDIIDRTLLLVSPD
jgi:processive 1,2-diacylglycerol beta-glucosyltransferase